MNGLERKIGAFMGKTVLNGIKKRISKVEHGEYLMGRVLDRFVQEAGPGKLFGLTKDLAAIIFTPANCEAFGRGLAEGVKK